MKIIFLSTQNNLKIIIIGLYIAVVMRRYYINWKEDTDVWGVDTDTEAMAYTHWLGTTGWSGACRGCSTCPPRWSVASWPASGREVTPAVSRPPPPPTPPPPPPRRSRRHGNRRDLSETADSGVRARWRISGIFPTRVQRGNPRWRHSADVWDTEGVSGGPCSWVRVCLPGFRVAGISPGSAYPRARTRHCCSYCPFCARVGPRLRRWPSLGPTRVEHHLLDPHLEADPGFESVTAARPHRKRAAP